MVHLSGEYLSLRRIADSGQCFRWRDVGDGKFEIAAVNRVLLAAQREDGGDVSLDCSDTDYQRFWRGYLDMDCDYGTYHQAALNAGLPFLTAAAEYSKGIRILRQDTWETLVSFIISQRKSIPSIKTCLSRLIEKFNHFPTPSDIETHDISDCGLGYRARYLHDAAAKFSLELTDFTSIHGVGAKVNNCVTLFALGQKDAFPRDVWINRVETEHFGGRFPEERFPGFAGVMQQYLFYYGRSLGRKTVDS